MGDAPQPLPTGVPLVAAIIVAAALSVFSNWRYGRNIGEVSCTYELSYSPSRQAFGIWALIYAACALTVAGQYIAYAAGSPVFASDYGNAFYALAWLCATCWTPTFTTNTPLSHVCAAALLCLCATCALAAAAIENAWHPCGTWPRRLLISTPFALLGGWTLAAAALSIGIAGRVLDARPDTPCAELDSPTYRNGLSLLSLPSTWTHPAHWLPVTLATSVAATCAYAREPIVPLPLAWAIFWMPPNVPNFLGFSALLGASVWSLCFVLASPCAEAA